MRTTVISAALLLATAVFAQPAPDWRSTLGDLYRLDVAFDVCKDMKPSTSDMLRLESAIAYVEKRVGLEEDELDELFDDVEREAAQPAAFCESMADAVARVRKIPQDYR